MGKPELRRRPQQRRQLGGKSKIPDGKNGSIAATLDALNAGLKTVKVDVGQTGTSINKFA